jgi:ELWxxDGT repeat protein
MALYFVEGLEPRRMLSRVEPAFDLDPRTESTVADSRNKILVAGNNAFINGDFGASVSPSNDEMYFSDDTASGTHLIADLVPGSKGLSVNSMVAFGTIALFTGLDVDGVSSALWRSDGTAQGTYQLLRDPNHAVPTEELTPAILNGKIYFCGRNPANTNQIGLFASDGTLAGTTQIIAQDAAHLTVMNGALYFESTTATGIELWRSDGTAAGTSLVKDINPGANSSSPDHLTVVGNTLFFTADDGTNGRQLWKSDGTSTGTMMVKVIDSFGFYPNSMVNANGTLLFSNSTSIWRSDGTSGGTSLIKTFQGTSQIWELYPAGSFTYFARPDGFYQTDGTVAGTRQVTSSSGPLTYGVAYSMTAFGSKMLCTASSSGAGLELWITDGTVAGTQLLKDVLPGRASSGIVALASNPEGTRAYFSANLNDGLGSEPWVTDGTTAGTHGLGDANKTSKSSSPSSFARLGNTLYFSVTGTTSPGLYKSDGTLAGTTFVDSFRIFQPNAFSGVTWIEFNGKLVFGGSPAAGGASGLVTSDGTAAGTAFVGGNISNLLPMDLTIAGSTLYMRSSVSGSQSLYQYDGSRLSAVSGATGIGNALAAYNNVLYYGKGSDLWRIGGAGPELVASGVGTVQALAVMNNQLLIFTTLNSTAFLYRYDGSTMTQVTSVAISTSVIRWGAVVSGGLGVFSIGNSLWRTDLTGSGTFKLATVSINTPAVPGFAAVVDGKLYFDGLASTPNGGAGLWVSDGTVAGTQRLTSVHSSGQWIMAADGRVYFPGTTASDGIELWDTDGTIAGTQEIVNLGPYSESGVPGNAVAVGNILYFNGDDRALVGSEVFKVNPDVTPPNATAISADLSGPAPQIAVQFDETVQRSIDVDDLIVTNTDADDVLPSNLYAATYDRASNTAKFTFLAPLPNGNYTATLARSGVSDLSKNLLTADVSTSLWALNGDGDRSGKVDIQDFNLLATNFGTTVGRFDLGNYDYSADGVVNIIDFNVLATNFGKVLTPTQPLQLAPISTTVFAGTPAGSTDRRSLTTSFSGSDLLDEVGLT